MNTEGDRGKGALRRSGLERRAPLERKSELKRTSGLKRVPPRAVKRNGFTPASKAQKEKVARQGARIENQLVSSGLALDVVDPAHVVSRALGGCDHEDCVVPLPRRLHCLYDEGKLDVLPYLTFDEQAHAVSHLGILGALKRTTGERYVPAAEEAAR